MSSRDERERAQKQLEEMLRYGDLSTCRRAYLLNYFGEAWNEKNCNGCDICLPPRPPRQQLQQSRGVYAPINYDQVLFEQLRTLRREIADAKSVPPYVIFGDKSLQEMAQLYPQSMETFGRIFGVGKEKLAQYGELFLKCICTYAVAEGRTDQVSQKPAPAPKKKVSDTVLATLELLKEGCTLEEIAATRGFVMGTIINHLEMAIEEGLTPATDHLIPPTGERHQKITAAFNKIGTGLLLPIRTYLGETYSFEEIRLARFYYLREQTKKV